MSYDFKPPHERLRIAREAAGHATAADAARVFDWKIGTYRHHENGTRNFTTKQASVYGQAFDVSPMWLVGWTESQERHLFEDFRDTLLGVGKTRSAKQVGDELAARFRLTFVPRLRLSEFGGGVTALEISNDFFIFDAEIIQNIAPKARDSVIAVEVDQPVQSPAAPTGSLVIVDREASVTRRQDLLWLYSYGQEAGLSRMWHHPDGTIELRDAGGASPLRIQKADMTLWGEVLWIAKAP